MKPNLDFLYSILQKGDPRKAWQCLMPIFNKMTEAEKNNTAETLATILRNDTQGLDPIVIEQFIGNMLLGMGKKDEAAEVLQNAIRWKEVKARAEKELGLDFDNWQSLYTFLGANDFREYAKKRNKGDINTASFTDERTVGFLFHALQMQKALPLLKNFPAASWLTLGDGRHAIEARFLNRHGARAFATNLDPSLLEEAKELGLIEDFGVENMENLSFKDKSFDFICCKDSLHHSIMPYKALYEMLRVARKGIFLIEPFDQAFANSPIYETWKDNCYYFENGPGNYAYPFSEREMEKLCISHGWKCLAVRGIAWTEPGRNLANSTDEAHARLWQEHIKELEKMANNRERAWTCLCSILLHELPSDNLQKDLESAGFKIIKLPVNPYLKRDVLKNLDQLFNRS